MWAGDAGRSLAEDASRRTLRSVGRLRQEKLPKYSLDGIFHEGYNSSNS